MELQLGFMGESAPLVRCAIPLLLGALLGAGCGVDSCDISEVLYVCVCISVKRFFEIR